MKYKAAVLFVLFLSVYSTHAQAQAIKLLGATTQTWATEASPGYSGTTVTIKLKILTRKPVTFKNLWMGKDYAPFEVQTYATGGNTKYTQGDSVLIVHVKTNMPSDTLQEHKPKAINYTGAALLQYQVGCKVKYLIIKALTYLGT